MALERIAYPTDLSTQADFSAHGDLIEAGFWDKVNAPLLVRDGVIPQGVVLQVGSVIYHGTSDTTITGTASDYVEITPDGATATAAYVSLATITDTVTWNAQYNGYYNSTATKLYIFDEGKALANSAVSTILTRYVSQQANGDVQIGRDLAVERNETVGGTLGVTGNATVGGTLGVTGNATMGGTLDVTGVGCDFSGRVRPRTNPVTGSQSMGGLSSWTPSRGLYNASIGTNYGGYIVNDGSTSGQSGSQGGPYDGSSVKIGNSGNASITVYYARF